MKIGDPAPYFSLSGTDGRIYSLREFADKPVLVILFTSNHCPYSQAYEKRLAELALEYAPNQVQFIAICSNDASAYPEDNFEHMVEKAQSLGLPYPYLHDPNQVAAKAFDAACTPEAYVFNIDRVLVYHGAIDDNYNDASQVKKHFLEDAISAALSGEPIENPVTSVFGCTIKWKL